MKNFIRPSILAITLVVAALACASLTGTITNFDLDSGATDYFEEAAHLDPLQHKFGFQGNGTGFDVEFSGWTYFDTYSPGSAAPQSGYYSVKINGATVTGGTFNVPPTKPLLPNLLLNFPLTESLFKKGSNVVEFSIELNGPSIHGGLYDRAVVIKS